MTDAKQFDEIFCERLLETLSAESLPQGVCGPNEETDRLKTTIRGYRWRLPIRDFNRVALNWLSNFHRIDLLREIASRVTCSCVEQCHLNSQKDQSIARDKIWPKAVLVVFFIVAIWITISTYYQYAYDINTTRLARLQAQFDTVESWPPEVDSLRRKLESNRLTAYQTLEAIGASYREWSWSIEVASILFVILFFMWLVVVPILWVRSERKTSLAPLVVMSNEAECHVRFHLVLHELKRMVACSRSLSESKLDRLDKFLQVTSSGGPMSFMNRQMKWAMAKQVAHRHQLIVELLKQIALEGRLNQLYRSTADRERIARMTFVLITALPALLIMGFILGYYYLYKLIQATGQHLCLQSWRDWLGFYASASLFISLCSISTTFVATIIQVTLQDQFGSVVRLRQLIYLTINKNEQRLCVKRKQSKLGNRAHRLSGGPLPITKSDLMVESDSMVVVLQCRLFTKSFLWARDHLSELSTLAVLFCVISSVSLRIHMAYFDENIRRLVIAIQLITLNNLFAFLVPMAVLHKRSVSVTTLLWSLSAQLSHLDSLDRRKDGSEFNESDWSVASYSLRQELTYSGLQAQRLACKILMIPITYRNLIRLAFWALLIAVPLTDGTAAGGGSSNFLKDPFRLGNIF